MAFTQGNDINILQASDTAIVGAGAGNDRYVLDAAVLAPGQKISISDAQGVNTLHLVGGLEVVSSLVTSSALQLTLNNGSVVTVLGAGNFNFQTGGNPISGAGGLTQNYATFAQDCLGVSLPAPGAAPVKGGTVTVNAAGGVVPPVNLIDVTAAGATGTADADVFVIDAVTALLDVAGTNYQPTITGFGVGDKLRVDLPTANAAITTLAQLNGQQGVSVQIDPFASAAVIDFGADANGGQLVAVTLAGVTDSATVVVEIV